MPKFNRKMIKGADQLEEEMQKEKGNFKVGAGLISLRSENTDNEIVYLSRGEIQKNKNNKYSIGNIKSLAWSIDMLGLVQPLHVNKNPEDGIYTLLGGERRLTAIDMLIDDPDNTKWTTETRIPCVLKDPDNIPLPLDPEMKESLSIISTNKESRTYTDADKLMEIREWKKIITALREAGVESIPGSEEGNAENGIAIKGEKTRDILVKTTGMSRGTINKFEKVENQGSNKVKEALLNNEISLSTANTLATNLEKSRQDELIDKARKEGVEISGVELKSNKRKKEFTDGMEENQNSDQCGITEKVFRKDISNITRTLKKKNVYLDNEEQMSYYKYIRELEKLLIKEN